MKSFIPSIYRLIKGIENANPGSGRQLAEVVAKHIPEKEEMLPLADFDHPHNQSYGRTLLYHKNNFCIYLMAWNPGDFTAIHDHGTTEWGCVYAFDDFTHRLYTLKENLLTLKSDKKFLKSSIARIGSDTVHMMGNMHQKKQNLSLHIYGTSKPEKGLAQQSKVYFPELGKTVISDGPAYLHHQQQPIHNTIIQLETEKETLKDYLELRKEQAKLSGNQYPEILDAYQSS
ncbi:MAG: cysteine dioxygenase [Bacteroidota bacterium]